MNALDLVVVAPELQACGDLVQRLEELGGRAEIVLDRRRGERRGSGSQAGDERRRADRRTFEIRDLLQALGWVIIPADQRPPSRSTDGT